MSLEACVAREYSTYNGDGSDEFLKYHGCLPVEQGGMERGCPSTQASTAWCEDLVYDDECIFCDAHHVDGETASKAA